MTQEFPIPGKRDASGCSGAGVQMAKHIPRKAFSGSLSRKLSENRRKVSKK